MSDLIHEIFAGWLEAHPQLLYGSRPHTSRCPPTAGPGGTGRPEAGQAPQGTPSAPAGREVPEAGQSPAGPPAISP